jgi:hypothetical protein
MELEDLTAVFGYKNRRAAVRAIKNNTFPIPTYELAGRRVANVAVVKKYFDEKTDEGVLEIDLQETA